MTTEELIAKALFFFLFSIIFIGAAVIGVREDDNAS